MSLPDPVPGQYCYDLPLPPQIAIFVDTSFAVGLIGGLLVGAFGGIGLLYLVAQLVGYLRARRGAA